MIELYLIQSTTASWKKGPPSMSLRFVLAGDGADSHLSPHNWLKNAKERFLAMNGRWWSWWRASRQEFVVAHSAHIASAPPIFRPNLPPMVDLFHFRSCYLTMLKTLVFA
jgi:hypothetical protein